MKLIAYDADVAVYHIGFACQTQLDFGDGMASPIADTAEATARLRALVKTIRKKCGQAPVVFCLSSPSNFRKEVYPAYKGNRVGSYCRPVLYDWIREWFQDQDHWEMWDGLEADDVMGVLATRVGASVVSIDKDMQTIPCTLINPMKDWKPQVVTEDEADRWHLVQTIVGDPVDNYPGCPGVGIVGANRYLAGGIWPEVVEAFEDRGYTEEDALVQARLARILRDEDYPNGQVKLWTPK